MSVMIPRWSNEITGANAGGPRPFPILTNFGLRIFSEHARSRLSTFTPQAARSGDLNFLTSIALRRRLNSSRDDSRNQNRPALPALGRLWDDFKIRISR